MGAHDLKAGKLMHGNGCNRWHDCFSCRLSKTECIADDKLIMRDSGYLPEWVQRWMCIPLQRT